MVIEPIEKLEKAFVGQILGCAKVEIRIEFVDDGLVPDDGKEADAECQQADKPKMPNFSTVGIPLKSSCSTSSSGSGSTFDK